MKKKLIIYSIIAVLAFLGGQHVGNKATEAQKKVHQQEIERLKREVKVVTRIVERADGSKVTEIIEESKEESSKVSDIKSEVKLTFKPKWSVSLSAGGSGVFRGSPTYTLGVDRRVLGGLFVGLYGRTDKELGLSLRYEF